jgi:hypothetical protein
MFDVPADISWARSLAALAVLAAGGFAVSWVTTDVLEVPRRRYIGVLAASTAGLTAATLWITEASAGDLLGHNWAWGLAVAIATGAVLGYGLRKMPASLPRSGHDLHEAEAWEGVVYGISEGALLSALPAFVAWQAAADAGWSTIGAWVVALGASAAVIAVHHFGYWDYRNKSVLEVIAGCSILTVGYLATGSVLAPILGHVIMHVAGVTKGVELPPHRHAQPFGA